MCVAVNLHSKDAWVRESSLAALRALARRCAELAPARALLAHAFAEYNGASGKLTSSEDKIAVLNVSLTLKNNCSAVLSHSTLIKKVLT